MSSLTPGEDHPAAKRLKATATGPSSVPTSTSSSKRPGHARQSGPSSAQSRPGTGGVGGSSSLGGGSGSGGSGGGGVGLATPATRLSSPEDFVQDQQQHQPQQQQSQQQQQPTSLFGRFDTVTTAKQPKEVVTAAIVAYLRSHIEKEEGYLEFAGSKGRLLPIPDLLKGYRFATRIVNSWANRKTPLNVEGCPNKRITKARMKFIFFGSEC